MALPSFLSRADLQLLLFAGKGGVGKTTCAAATALYLAVHNPQAPYLLVSVDPAHSLRDCLGDEPLPDNLQVVELDAKKCLDEFLANKGAVLREIARRGTFLDEADLDRFFDLSLPGLDELLAFLRIAEWTQARRYRAILVDTAPSGHTERLLDVPTLLRDWVEALDDLLAKHRFLAQQFAGAYREDETDRLLSELGESARRTQALLCSERSCLVTTLVAEPLCIDVTLGFLERLHARRLHLGPLIVNRLRPEHGCAQCARVRAAQQGALDARLVTAPVQERWGLPLLAQEVRGRAALVSLWELAQPLPEPSTAAPASGPEVAPQIRSPAPLPPPERRLLVFAGKGGVGKTTLACATALALSAGRKVVLLSTDPAHSLSAALGTAVGAEPRRVAPQLTALAPDPEAQWRDWRDAYKDELSDVLRQKLRNADLAFDRRALERLLDLTPPGLDEIVSLTRLTEILEQEPDALVVLDTAPTGHLLRLLEMPAILEGWLRALFAVLLKQKSLMRLPRLTDRLIALSKHLKALRRLLAAPQQTSLCAVTIPTYLAYAETQDLLAACARAGIAVSRIFVNQATAAASPGCRLCAALCEREGKVLTDLTAAAAPIELTTVTLGTPPLGLDALAALGRRLYGMKEEGAPGDGLRR